MDKAKAAARAARWRKKNPEKSRAISQRANAKRRAEKPDVIKGYQAAYREKNREQLSAKERERTFGLTLAEYSAMVAAQDNKCAICDCGETQTRNGKVKALAVDHNHETGEIRGLLCADCNQAIGKMKENRGILLAAIKYLDKHSKQENVICLKEVQS